MEIFLFVKENVRENSNTIRLKFFCTLSCFKMKLLLKDFYRKEIIYIIYIYIYIYIYTLLFEVKQETYIYLTVVTF